MNSINILAQKFAVANGFDLTIKNRKAEFVQFKQHLTRILRDEEKMSMMEIGKAINKDHSTIVYCLKTHHDYCQVELNYLSKYKEYLSKWNQLKMYTIPNYPIIKLLKENWNDPNFESIQKKLSNNDIEVLAEFINNVILPEYEQH